MIKQFEIWLANLNPGKGIEMEKVRPVVFVQTDLLNNLLSSTIICLVTSQVNRETNILRIHIGKRYLEKEGAIVVDQMRAIDNRRLLKRLGKLQPVQIDSLKDSLRTILEV